MTQKDKELLLKDIYARIPYGVKGCCEDETFCTTPLQWYAENTLEYSVNYMVIKNGWRPYLFPLSSMTEEQFDEFFAYFHDVEMKEIETSGDYLKAAYLGENAKRDWLNKNHFDYHYLIPMGLANDATGLNIY